MGLFTLALEPGRLFVARPLAHEADTRGSKATGVSSGLWGPGKTPPPGEQGWPMGDVAELFDSGRGESLGTTSGAFVAELIRSAGPFPSLRPIARPLVEEMRSCCTSNGSPPATPPSPHSAPARGLEGDVLGVMVKGFKPSLLADFASL